MRPLPSSFRFLAPSTFYSSLLFRRALAPSPAQGSLFSRSFSPSLLPTKVLEKVGDSSRLESSRGDGRARKREGGRGKRIEWRMPKGGGKGVKIPSRSGWSFERMERFDFINESNRGRIRDGLSFLVLRSFFFFFSSFSSRSSHRHLFTTRHAPSSTSQPPDRLKNHYRETISWEGRARETRGKYLDGFNRGSFKSQRREPPVHRACLSSETSEGDKIDRRPLPFIPRSTLDETTKDSREIKILAMKKSSIHAFSCFAHCEKIDRDRGVRATAIYFTLYFKV